MLKVGDLVTWTESGDKIFNNYYSFGYKSPGVLVEISERPEGENLSYEIYWADGKSTTEHACFIRKVEI